VKLLGRILTIGAASTLGCGTAQACDLELSLVQDYLASIDVTGMNLEQQLATRDRALTEFHEAAMLKAKAAFLRRFNVPAAAVPAMARAEGASVSN
jgi:hypothetical protein